jgi:hypothetical protein
VANDSYRGLYYNRDNNNGKEGVVLIEVLHVYSINHWLHTSGAFFRFFLELGNMIFFLTFEKKGYI